jgi:thiamine biosynthesis lipoprotein
MGIRHPRRVGELIASIPVHGGALATSGDYERYFESGGRRYCHILSPLTGQPASRWQSISVLAPLATTAGATTTVAMLKEEGALEFLQASRLGFLAIDLNGEIFTHQPYEP